MKRILIVALSCMSIIACKDKKESATDKTVSGSEAVASVPEAVKVDKEAICIIDKLSVRVSPGKKGKWITSLSIGEKIIFSGEEVTDSITKKVYSKVKLIDGKEGWTRSRFIVVDGKVATMLEEVNVYKRPDLLTKTNKKYSPMDIIAIVKTQGDDWIQIKGKRRDGQYVEEAWVKSLNISEASVDIATAKFATLALSKGNMGDQIKALQELVGNSDLSSSKFISLINGKISDLEKKNEESKEIVEKAEIVEPVDATKDSQ